MHEGAVVAEGGGEGFGELDSFTVLEEECLLAVEAKDFAHVDDAISRVETSSCPEPEAGRMGLRRRGWRRRWFWRAKPRGIVRGDVVPTHGVLSFQSRGVILRCMKAQ